MAGLSLVVASCVQPRAPEPAPVPTPTPTPAPSPPPPEPDIAWTDRNATPGDWSYRAEGGASIASFGPGGTAMFVMRCDRAARRITLSRPGTLDTGRSAQLVLHSTAGMASYPLANIPGTPAMVGATLAGTDPFLDKLVYTRGRFLVRTEGAADLVLPAWAEVSRIVEDCRA